MSTNEKISNLIKVYRQNISDNKKSVEHWKDKCAFTALKFKHEAEILATIIDELSEVLKKKSEK